MPNYNASVYQNSTRFSSRRPRVYVVRWVEFFEHNFSIEEQLSLNSIVCNIHIPFKEERIGALTYKDLLRFIDTHVIRKLGKRIGKVIDIKEETNYWTI